MSPWVSFDTVSKGPFHNFYGVWNPVAGVYPNGGSGGPVTGSGVPNAELGDLYYNDGTTTPGDAGLWVCTTPGAWSVAVWQMLGLASLDKRESKYIVGNIANGDTLTNSDYLGGPGLRSAILAVGASVRHGGRIYIREGSYGAGADAVPAPTALFQAPYQLSQAPLPGNNIRTGIWIDGAGREAVRLINTNANPMFILDYAGATELTFPVMLTHMTIVGSGLVNGAPIGGTGYATVEVGYSDMFGAAAGANPKCKKYVTLDDIEIDGGGIPPLTGGDNCALVLVDDPTGAATDNTSSYFKGMDLAIHNSGSGPNAIAQFYVSPYFASLAQICVELQLIRCKVYDNTDVLGRAAGFKANLLEFSTISDSYAQNNHQGGWWLTQCEDVSFEACHATNNSYTIGGSAAGFYIETCKSCRLVNCYATANFGDDSAGEDYLAQTSQNCLWESCISHGVGPETPNDNNGFTLMTCTGCIVNGCTSYQHTDTAVQTPLAGHGFVMISGLANEFVNCVSVPRSGDTNNVNAGFYVQTSTQCSINDCISNRNLGVIGPSPGHGFWLDGSCEYVIINDCSAQYNGAPAGGAASYGVYLGALTVRCEVVGGTYFVNTGITAPNPYNPNVRDAVGGATTNELSHFQFV